MVARSGFDLSSDVVAAVTLVLGAALLVAPRRTSSVLGLGTWPIATRMVGGTDLALGLGLAAARPHWPWMSGRSALNLVLVAVYLRQRHDPAVGRRARRGAAAMTALTVSDASLAVGLRARGR